MSLPRIVLVYETSDKNDDDVYLVANRNVEEAMSDVPHHKQRVVGTYRLVGKAHLTNTVKRIKEVRVK